MPHEHNEQEQTEGKIGDKRHIACVAVGQSNQSECDATQAPECEQGAHPIDTRRRFWIKALGHMTQRNPDGRQCEDWVNEKDGLPSNVIDNPAAQQRTDGGCNRGKPSPGPNGSASLSLGK